MVNTCDRKVACSLAVQEYIMRTISLKKLSMMTISASSMWLASSLGGAIAQEASVLSATSSAAISGATISGATISGALTTTSSINTVGSSIVPAIALQSGRSFRGSRGFRGNRSFRGNRGFRGGRNFRGSRGFRGNRFGGRGFRGSRFGSRGFRSSGFHSGFGFRRGFYNNGFFYRGFGHSDAFLLSAGVLGGAILVNNSINNSRQFGSVRSVGRSLPVQGQGSLPRSNEEPEVLIGSLDGNFQPAYNLCVDALQGELNARGVEVNIGDTPQSGGAVGEGWRFSAEFTTRDERGAAFLRTMTCEANSVSVSYLEIV